MTVILKNKYQLTAGTIVPKYVTSSVKIWESVLKISSINIPP